MIYNHEDWDLCEQVRRGEQGVPSNRQGTLHFIPPDAAGALRHLNRLISHCADEIGPYFITIMNVVRWHGRDALLAAGGEAELKRYDEFKQCMLLLYPDFLEVDEELPPSSS